MQPKQPQILLQLRQKSKNLQTQDHNQKQQNKIKQKHLKSIEIQIDNLKKQKQIQQRKNKSLIVLVCQLQRQYDQIYLDNQNIQYNQNQLIGEASVLRALLIIQTEKVNQKGKLNKFLKQLQANKNKAIQYLFINIDSQIKQIIQKIKSNCKQSLNLRQINIVTIISNAEENANLQEQISTLKIQQQRQKTQLKQSYETYLQKINQLKTKLVNFNQTHNCKIMTELFIKEISLLQQERLEVQENNKNLQYHYQNLHEQLSKIKIQNKQLKSFFLNTGQQSKLANKMKTRIQQLRDTLIEQKKKNSSLRLMKLNKILENIRIQYQKYKQSNDYLQIKLKQQKNSTFQLDQKNIIDFFTGYFNNRDQQINLLKQQQISLMQKIKQAKLKKSLLQNQIATLEQGLSFHGGQQKYRQTNLRNQITNNYNFRDSLNNEHKKNKYDINY